VLYLCCSGPLIHYEFMTLAVHFVPCHTRIFRWCNIILENQVARTRVRFLWMSELNNLLNMISASLYNTAALQVVRFEVAGCWGIITSFFNQVGWNHTQNGSAVSSICFVLVLCPTGHQVVPNGRVVNLRLTSDACIRSERSDISSIRIK
jgi:hypothetical protein